MDRSLTFRHDDLTSAPVRALITRHLVGMREHSPACSVHALDIDRLRQPDVSFWSVWSDDVLVGCGALKQIDARRGELKSMRVADSFLGRGIGKALLAHLMAEARARGYSSLWLETGSSSAFAPAIAMYAAAGFTRCGPFESYADDPFSIYMTLPL